jgi:signal transduction histidine kinase/ligand-binding sensor domain-containing protein/DNA-binding response OmpR family regulator
MTAEQGFPQSIAYQLAQDTVGNLWVTTEEGVVRFNAHETYTYTEARGLPKGFGESIRAVCVGPKGTIWIGGERGAARYNASFDRFEELERNKLNPRLIKDLAVSSTGVLWIAGSNGLWRHDPDTETSMRLADVRNLETILQAKGALLFGGIDGLYYLNLLTGEWTKTHHEFPVSALAETTDGFLLGTRNGEFYALTEDLMELTLLADFGPVPVRMLEPQPGGGWYVATDGGGVHVFDENLLETDVYRNDVDNLSSISSNGIYDLLTDREGILWVATYGGGVNKFDPYGNTFRHLIHQPNTDRSLGHPFTRAILEDEDGRIWFGTKKGISIWSPEKGDWQHLLHAGPQEGQKIVMGLCEQGAYIWAATYQGRLLRINKQDFSVSRIDFASEKDQRQGRIFTAVIDSNGSLWVGGVNMNVYQIAPSGSVTSFPVTQVKVMAAMPGGGVYVSSRDGLKMLKEERGEAAGAKISSIGAVDAYLAAIGNRALYSILPDKKGGLYLGTSGDGLLHYDLASDMVSALTKANGLPSNSVQSILIDAEENIWTGTSRGLARIEVSEQDTLVQIYTKADGLVSTELNYGSAAQLRSGTMLFGGPGGVNVFDPFAVEAAGASPTVVLEDLSLFSERQVPGGDVLPAHINALKQLQLTYDQNALTFHFAGIAQAAAGKVRYRWKMSGLGDRWSEPTGQRQINFTNLEPGRYVFSVEANTTPGGWGPTRQLPILITPPWWKTWWAYLAYFGLLIVGAYVLFRISRGLIRRRNAERQIDFFNNITHELKTPLAILLASLEDVTESTDQAGVETNKKIRSTVKRLNALFEQLLNFHKASSTGKSRHVTAFVPGDHLRELTTRFTPLLNERELSLAVNNALAPSSFHYDIDIFDKIVFNLVSNAVKYSRPGGSISVELGETTGGKLSLQVADTGIGIPEDQQKYILREYYRARNAVNSQLPGTGLGLMMVKSMVEKEGGSIRFISKENVGTTFTVEMEDRKADLPAGIVVGGAEGGLPSSTSLAPAAAPDEDTAGLESAQILLVEDNDELRASLSKRLRKHFRVITASNGRAGLEKATELFPDLIITDLIMPEMDGMELSRAIQADIQLNHIPIYMLTVLHNSAQKVESIEAGVTEYLEKPVNFDLLLAKITNTLSWRKRMRERYAAQDEAGRADQHRTDRESEFIGGLEKFMLDNLANDSLSVQDLCRHIGMSRTSLYMKMKNLIDFSPQDFIIHTRLKEARRLLAETDETVKSIAYDCGFSNPKYFSTSFKKKYGMSPMAFRKGLL